MFSIVDLEVLVSVCKLQRINQRDSVRKEGS